MISIQKRLFLTDQSKQEGRDFEPLRSVTEESFIALSKSDEFNSRASQVTAGAETWWQEQDPERKKALHDELQKKKRALLETVVFQGVAPDEHRQQKSIVLNGLYSADFDGIDDPAAVLQQWRDLWPVIDPTKHPLSRMAEELGLVYIGKSILGHGFRLVGKCQLELDLWQNQLWLGRQLQLPVVPDRQCKDSCRASYMVPYDNIRFLSPELFTYHNEEYEAKWGRVYRKESGGQSPQSDREAPAAKAAEKVAGPVCYLGVPLSEYVDMYWKLFYHGQTPTEGARDTLTFELACHMRHITGFSRDVLNAVIPCYDGFPEQEKLKAIDSALREERHQMPVRMRQVLDAVARRHQDNAALGRAVDSMAEENDINTYERLKTAIPFGMRDSLENQQRQLAMSLLVPHFPIVGALATHVRLDIHNEGFKHLNLQAYIAGKSASNKQHITEVWNLWTALLKAHDDEMRRQEGEQEALLKRKKNAKELPEEKVFPQRLQASVTSMTQILTRLRNAGGEHLLSYTEESDVMAKRLGPAWSDMSVLLRAAYDNSAYSQDFKSENSVRVWLDKVLWNVILCGTEDSLYRFFRNYTDGSLTRVIIGCTPDNTYAPLVIRKKRSERALKNIQRLIALLPLMQGDLVLPKLEQRCQQWLERVRLESMKDDDRVRANQRMRIGVSVMRCLCCMMLCDFGGWLLRVFDGKRQLPEWADDCQTAEEYLQQHPKATEYWIVRKFQKKNTLDAFDVLADYFMDNVLYYFRARIEKAYGQQETAVSGNRRAAGRNDSIYAKLPTQFTIAMAQQLRPDDPTGNRTRSMIKNWLRQGLTRNVGVGTYEKNEG